MDADDTHTNRHGGVGETVAAVQPEKRGAPVLVLYCVTSNLTRLPLGMWLTLTTPIACVACAHLFVSLKQCETQPYLWSDCIHSSLP